MILRSETTNESGFTLFEMLVVIAIVGLMTTLLVSHGWQAGPVVHARATAQTVYRALRETRSEAMASNRSAAFTLDVAHHVYQWGHRPPDAFAADVQVALLTSQDELATVETGGIRFDPDGGSSGGRVTIAGGGQIWLVGVDWLSGHVSIEMQKR